MYETDVSDEEIAVIQALEAEPTPTSETGRRFRRLFNAIEYLEMQVGRLEKRLETSERARIKTGYRGGWGR
jgi:hypothetical protein